MGGVMCTKLIIQWQDLGAMYCLMRSGPLFNIRTVFVRYGIPMLKIRRSRNRLIFNMWIHISVRRHLYIETTPCWLWKLDVYNFIARCLLYDYFPRKWFNFDRNCSDLLSLQKSAFKSAMSWPQAGKEPLLVTIMISFTMPWGIIGPWQVQIIIIISGSVVIYVSFISLRSLVIMVI